MTVCRGERLSTIWLALAANKYCSSRAQVPRPTSASTAAAAAAATRPGSTSSDSFSPMARRYSASHHHPGGVTNDRRRFSYVHSGAAAQAHWSVGLLYQQSRAGCQATGHWGGVARPQSATPSTHTPSAVRTQIHGQRYRIRIQLQIHSQWPSLMLSDAMLQLTIFPNAINNRSLSFSP